MLDPAYPKPRARDIVPIGLLILFIVVPAGSRARGHRSGATDGGHRLRRRRVDRRCLGPETEAPTFGTPGYTDDPDLFPVNVVPSPTEGPQRVNVLLVGVDSAPAGART